MPYRAQFFRDDLALVKKSANIVSASFRPAAVRDRADFVKPFTAPSRPGCSLGRSAHSLPEPARMIP
jgi:hypothetical protein